MRSGGVLEDARKKISKDEHALDIFRRARERGVRFPLVGDDAGYVNGGQNPHLSGGRIVLMSVEGCPDRGPVPGAERGHSAAKRRGREIPCGPIGSTRGWGSREALWVALER